MQGLVLHSVSTALLSYEHSLSLFIQNQGLHVINVVMCWLLTVSEVYVVVL